MKTRKLLPLLLFVLAFLSCDNAASKIHKNPEEYLIKELRNKRVLMLGDFGHGQPLPYHSILELLNTWVSLVEQGSDVDKNIVLVLESDSAGVDLLKRFIASNDPVPLLNHWFLNEHVTMEHLEFYANLRRLSKRIDSLNTRLPEQKRVVFDFLGPEGVPVYKPNISLDSLSLDIFDYFLKERDVNTARRVIDYLGIHKDTKAIVYYGNAHLIKTLSDKNIEKDSRLKNKDTRGFYLAHYLKKEFGGGQVLSVNQLRLDTSDAFAKKITSSILANLGKDNFYIKADALFRKLLFFPRYDGFVVRREPFVHGHEIGRIFSRNVACACLLRMDEYARDPANALFERYFLLSITGILPYLTGTNFEYPIKPEAWFKSGKPAIVLREWKDWITANGSAVSQRLESKDFQDNVKRLYVRSFGSRVLKEQLLSIGFGDNMWNISGFSENQWDSLIWPEAIDRIKCLNAIGRNWFGDSSEQDKAHDFLVHYTGKTFSDPDLYLKWFRSNRDSVSY
jgi:hypothetical protein